MDDTAANGSWHSFVGFYFARPQGGQIQLAG
jgi:hypothetical protein